MLARAGLLLASIHASATPVWPAAGLALAAILLRGVRVWPAIFAASLAANATNEIANVGLEGQLLAALGIAIGNTLEAVVSGQLITTWSGGARTFERPSAAAKFALLCLAPGTVISAILGVGSLVLAGSAEFAQFPAIAFTWWLGNVAGALVATPVIVLWTTGRYRPFDFDRFIESTTVQLVAIVVGLIAFSPLIEQTVTRSALSILAILPLLAGALRCGPRDTATAAFILSCFAVWGTLTGSGPFAGATLNNSFLLLITFMIGCAVPSLILSADVAERKRVEAQAAPADAGSARRVQPGDRRHRADRYGGAVHALSMTDSARSSSVRRTICCGSTSRTSSTPMISRRCSQLLGQAIQHGRRSSSPRSATCCPTARARLGQNTVSRPSSIPAARCVISWWSRRTSPTVVSPSRSLHRAHDELERRVHQRTLEMRATNDVLHTEIEQRNRVEAALKRDIAERRKAQRALVESERRFRLVIQGVTDYAIFMLDPDGYITNWNTGAQRIHQYTEAEIVGQHFGRFYTEEERQRGEPARALQVAAYEGKYVAEGRQRAARREPCSGRAS